MRDDLLNFEKTGYVTRFLVCHMCGREFGTASLTIHQKQCALKQQASMTRKHQRGSTAPAKISSKDMPINNDKLAMAYEATRRGEMSTGEFNALSLKEYEDSAVEKGMKHECFNCKRTFARVEGLEKHRVLCERKLGTGGGIYARKYRPEAEETSLEIKESAMPRPASKQHKRKSTSQQLSSSPKTPTSAQRYEPTLDRVKSLSKFCTECGENFAKIQDCEKWKFCPNCGTQKPF